jgi:DNA-binding FadR family transcriptional regulator
MSTSSFSPTPVDSRKRADQVREGITAMIRAGQLQTGDKLPTETQLAAMFGVGRSSVREAVQSLVGLGIVEMRPGRGAFVSRVSIDDLARMIDGAVQLEFGAALQLHEVRAMIETTAARLAAVRRTEADLAAMRRANDDYANQAEHDPEDLLVEADLRFHRSIVEASHNVILGQVMVSISALLKEHRRQYASARERRFRDIVLTEHQAILDAIASGDPDAATKAVQIHMRDIWLQIEHTARRDGDSSTLAYSYLPMYP